MNEKTSFWQRLFRRNSVASTPISAAPEAIAAKGQVVPLEINPSDPLVAYVSSSPGVIDVDKLNLDSPLLARLKAEGYKLALPLVSQGELIGLLNLGPRMSEQEYSSDDFRLLNNLAIQASPAFRVAQLAQQQLVEARQRERIDQELRVARVIQETLLPKEVPQIDGWGLDVFWKPAREVSGDFYEFIYLPDGWYGILVADVTDKGVPAAMVMATTRSLLRAAAERLLEPGEVLARANELLYPDIPARMFVTCLYLILNPGTGEMRYANAGHNLPYLHGENGLVELRATGMPLGLLPGMGYEQKEVIIQPGEMILLSSDGLVEAHNGAREMYGFPRLKEKMESFASEGNLIQALMDDFNTFTGDDYEQEDDITLLTIARLEDPGSNPDSELLVRFSVPSQPGNERQAAARVLEAIKPLNLPESRLKRLETAVAEATMNAMEHGNQYQADKPAEIEVMVSEGNLIIHICDEGGEADIPSYTAPDLEAKLAGEQSPRGWGLFLIKNMVDEMNIIQTKGKHTIELLVSLNEGEAS